MCITLKLKVLWIKSINCIFVLVMKNIFHCSLIIILMGGYFKCLRPEEVRDGS